MAAVETVQAMIAVTPAAVATTKPATQAATSAWNALTSPVYQAAQWGGRLVQRILQAAFDTCAAIVGFVKPLFTFLGRVMVDYYDRIREICVEHKALLVPVTLALLAGGIIVLGSYFMLSSEGATEPREQAPTA